MIGGKLRLKGFKSKPKQIQKRPMPKEFDKNDLQDLCENGKNENKGNHEHWMEHSAVYKKLQLQEKSNEN